MGGQRAARGNRWALWLGPQRGQELCGSRMLSLPAFAVASGDRRRDFRHVFGRRYRYRCEDGLGSSEKVTSARDKLYLSDLDPC